MGLQVAQQMQAIDNDMMYPWDLSSHPVTGGVHKQTFMRRLSESDMALISTVAPLQFVENVADNEVFTVIKFDDAYAPLHALHSDRVQATWSRSSWSFPAQSRGLRAQMQLETLLAPGGLEQWTLQKEQVAIGCERTICCLVKNMLINMSVRRNNFPWEPANGPTEDDFVNQTLSAARMCGGCQKDTVGIGELINELRKRFSKRKVEEEPHYGGVKEMILAEQTKPIYHINFINGRRPPKTTADLSKPLSSIFPENFHFYDFQDTLTPDAAEVVSTISTKMRWLECLILPGCANDTNQSEFKCAFPSEIKFTNESSDTWSYMGFEKAFNDAFGDCEKDGQWMNYMARLSRMGKLKGQTIGDFYACFPESHALKTMATLLRKAKARNDEDGKEWADAGDAPSEREEEEEEIKVNDEWKKQLDDQEDQKAVEHLFQLANWKTWIKWCVTWKVPPLIDLALINTMNARVASLLAFIPGAQTMFSQVGNINVTVAADMINKYITENTDFRARVAVIEPRNIDGIIGAFIHSIDKSRSETGVDVVSDADIEHNDWKNKQYIVVPLFPDEPRLKASSPPRIFSITGYYPNIVEEENAGRNHFLAGSEMIRQLGIRVQRDRPTGAFQTYGEDDDETPIICYRGQYFYRFEEGKEGKDSKDKIWELVPGTGPRGIYVFPDHRSQWLNGRTIKAPPWALQNNPNSLEVKLFA
jgi:hypothetical protein